MVLVFLHRHQNFILYFIIHISFYIHLLSAWPKPKISESFLVASYTNHFKANYPLSFIRPTLHQIFLFTMTIIGIFYKVLHLFSYFYFIGTKTLQVWLPAGKQKILKKNRFIHHVFISDVRFLTLIRLEMNLITNSGTYVLHKVVGRLDSLTLF